MWWLSQLGITAQHVLTRKFLKSKSHFESLHVIMDPMAKAHPTWSADAMQCCFRVVLCDVAWLRRCRVTIVEFTKTCILHCRICLAHWRIPLPQTALLHN